MTRRLWMVSLLLVLGCTDRTRDLVPALMTGASTARDASANDARAQGDAKPQADAASLGRTPTLCGSHVCACDDGRDNDGDGLVDGLDPECTGPFDDDETSFATGAPTTSARCRDCFWDDNAGSGDDDCRYPTECLTGASPSGKGGSCASCDVSQQCVDVCGPRTPNGCDCFGCCEVHQPDGSRVFIDLRDTCSLALLKDEAACPRCVQSSSCRNDCGPCELCPGRTASDLAPECTAASDAGNRLPYTCNPGQQVCGANAPCPAGTYCQQGCCLYAVQ